MVPSMKRLANVFLSFALAGCGGSELFNRVPQPVPLAYQQLAADHGQALSSRISLADASISAAKETQGPQPGDWYACLKAVDGKDYAIFYQDSKVVDFRQALAIDNCAAMVGYRPLPPAKPTKPVGVR